MRRRAFILGLGGAAAWPLAARGQPSFPLVGFLSSGSEREWKPLVAAFLNGLRTLNYIEGQNIAVEYRWAEGEYGRLPEFTADLIARRSEVIVAVAPPAATAAKTFTTQIPIVFVSGVDPVAIGLVASLNRPGGNLTGFNFATADLASKTLQTIQQMLQRLGNVAMLVNSHNPNSANQARDFEAAARALGCQAHTMRASTAAEVDAAFVELRRRGVDALIVATDAFFLTQKERLVALSSRFAIPTVYNLRQYVLDGGLLSYGTSVPDAYRQVGIYVGRILRGEKPQDLPVLQPTKFELVINLKTAKALALDVPDTLLALADEVIE